MKIKNFRTVTIFFIVTLSACASKDGVQPIDRSVDQYINYKGVLVVELPQGEDWYVLKNSGGVSIYGKELDSSDHTFIASTQITNFRTKFGSPEEFLAFVKESRMRNTPKSRYSIISYEETLDQSRYDYCTRHVLKAEETGKGIVASKGYSCLHPNYPALGVTVLYSERTKGPPVSDQVRSEGERFINSLEFR